MEYSQITLPKRIRVEYEFGKRITNDFENTIHWLSVELKDININRPTILCFGGIATTNSRDANYVAKLIQRITPVEREANLISIIHSHFDGDKAASYFDENPDELFVQGYHEACQIVDEIFIPLVTDKESNRLMIQDACKNIRNINIFAHCYGYFSTVRYIEEAFIDSLKFLSYTDKEISRILRQVFVLSYEPGDIYQTSFSNLSVNSIASELWEDMVLNLPNMNFDNIEMQGDEKERILESDMYRTKDPELVRKFFRNNKYAIMKDDNHIDIFTNALTIDHTDHDLSTIYRHLPGNMSHYTNELGSITSDTIATAMKLALSNSVDNRFSSKFYPLDMNKMFNECSKQLELARTFFGEVAELNFE